LVIPLKNPLDHPIRLAVDLQTLPDVIVRFIRIYLYKLLCIFKGDDSIEIEANGEARYELVFKPKIVGNWNGG
jgi:hypothetical protein